MLGKIFISVTEVTTPSNVPNCESIPSVKSIEKKSIDQNGAKLNWLIASVKIINAKPGPDAVYIPVKYMWK